MTFELSDETLIGGLCLAAYLYDASGVRFAEEVHGKDHVQRYLDEKAELFSSHPARALAALDDEHFAKLMRVALARHGRWAAGRAANSLPGGEQR